VKAALTETVTVRLPSSAMRKVRARARALGVTPSKLIRVALERELGGTDANTTAMQLTRRWVGSLKNVGVRGRDARRALESWDPDRRG
jgi:hypothetical protein